MTLAHAMNVTVVSELPSHIDAARACSKYHFSTLLNRGLTAAVRAWSLSLIQQIVHCQLSADTERWKALIAIQSVGAIVFSRLENFQNNLLSLSSPSSQHWDDRNTQTSLADIMSSTLVWSSSGEIRPSPLLSTSPRSVLSKVKGDGQKGQAAQTGNATYLSAFDVRAGRHKKLLTSHEWHDRQT